MEIGIGHTEGWPRWRFPDDAWAKVDEPQLDASFRIVPGTALAEPDACMHESACLLRHLYGADDLDALGGRAAVQTLFSLLRQFASDNPAVPVILKAIRRPVTVLRSGSQCEYAVRPARFREHYTGNRPALTLYHSGKPLALPSWKFDLHDDSIQFYFPDHSYREFSTVEIREWAEDSNGNRMYAGAQRSISTCPATSDALRSGKPTPLTVSGYSINIIRIGTGTSSGTRNSVRFGINFSPCGMWVTDMWTKRSDFREFLRVYPRGFSAQIENLLGIET
ncbi:MAG: hypothetical protein CMJ25_24960 [Phycisphaerae bacterium]|nr:hypothetical protein [Phycisphaerae bacterium]|tara:strand:- start:1294 stop:2130 length:837 start_codon:yes stop_codon:yes gene_type:complete